MSQRRERGREEGKEECGPACFYGRRGKIWGEGGGGEGILHHRDGPMRGLGENVQRECPSNSGVNTTAASVSILDRRRHPPHPSNSPALAARTGGA